MCTNFWTCFEVVLSWAVLWQAGAWREELIQLLELLAERPLKQPQRRLHPLPWALPVPLRVHGHYTRAEIEAAFGVLSTESPWIHREGVLAHQASATDLLFITLRKSEALFSPSTRYRDLALGPALFHWESQSTTTAASPTGQRYIHHEARGSRVLLYRYAEACGEGIHRLTSPRSQECWGSQGSHPRSAAGAAAPGPCPPSGSPPAAPHYPAPSRR